MDSVKKFARTMSRQMSTQSQLQIDHDIEASKQTQSNNPNDRLLQRLTSVEERNHRRKMRQIFQLVSNHFYCHFTDY